MKHRQGIERRRVTHFAVVVFAFGFTVACGIALSDIPWWGGAATLGACLLVVSTAVNRL